MECTPDVFDDLFVDGIAEGHEAVEKEAAKEAAKEEPKPKPISTRGLTFDIETGPRPWEEIEPFWTTPPALPPWDDSMVKYGNTKDEAKRKEKYDAKKAEYDALLADEARVIEADKAKFLADAALSPVTGQVLAIGYYDGSNTFGPWIDDAITCGGEAAILRSFWRVYLDSRRQRTPMIGFNVNNFDLPFLVRRSWFHGIDVPAGLLSQGRYWDKLFVDLMVVWGCGVWGDRISLDKLCGFFGATRKTGSGADFARLYNDPATRGAALDYLKNDLRMTTEAAVKLGVF